MERRSRSLRYTVAENLRTSRSTAVAPTISSQRAPHQDYMTSTWLQSRRRGTRTQDQQPLLSWRRAEGYLIIPASDVAPAVAALSSGPLWHSPGIGGRHFSLHEVYNGRGRREQPGPCCDVSHLVEQNKSFTSCLRKGLYQQSLWISRLTKETSRYGETSTREIKLAEDNIHRF